MREMKALTFAARALFFDDTGSFTSALMAWRRVWAVGWDALSIGLACVVSRGTILRFAALQCDRFRHAAAQGDNFRHKVTILGTWVVGGQVGHLSGRQCRVAMRTHPTSDRAQEWPVGAAPALQNRFSGVGPCAGSHFARSSILGRFRRPQKANSSSAGLLVCANVRSTCCG
jgi:hypothetical protein